MTIKEIRSQLDQMKGRKEALVERLEKLDYDEKSLLIKAKQLEEAQTIIQTIAIQTQKELQYHISSITSSALEAIFPEPYELQVEFIEKRGRTETDIYFTNKGERIDPMTGSGGGAVDIAAFSLRCSMWKLQIPNSRNTIILDEPFRFLSRDLQSKAAQMLREISSNLRLQIIMVTHNDDLIEAADKLFIVYKKNGVSNINYQN